MSDGFIHSIKVPRLYKTAANIVKRVLEDGESLKQSIFNKKHPNIKALYALGSAAVRHETELNDIVRKSQIFVKEPRLDPWLARVLITELLWGKQSLKSDAKPIETILKYENEFREALKNIDKLPPDSSKTFNKVLKPRYVRINTLQLTIDEAIDKFCEDGYTLVSKAKSYEDYLGKLQYLDEFSFIQDFHIPELFAFSTGTHFYNHAGYHSGALILQDKASCFPAHLLNPSPNSTILDMCAAPGMKSTHLAAKIQNQGIIYSIEMNDRRYGVLCDFVQSTNANCIKTINADAIALSTEQCPDVEYILVDPSCSGSGMERLESDRSQNTCLPQRLKSLQSFQVLLLRHALLTFTKTKRVVYSTCSIYPEENEMVVDEILSDIGDSYKLIPIKTLLNNEWFNFSSNEFKCQDNCLYAKPEVDFTNGFFVAVFERNFDVPLPEYYKRGKTENNTKYKNEKNDYSSEVGVEEKADDSTNFELPKKQKKKKDCSEEIDKNDSNVNSSTLESEELPQKKKKKKKEKKELSEEVVIVEELNESVENELPKKRKKSKKSSKTNESV